MNVVCPILNAIKFFLFDWGINKSSNARCHKACLFISDIHLQFLNWPLEVDSEATVKQACLLPVIKQVTSAQSQLIKGLCGKRI